MQRGMGDSEQRTFTKVNEPSTSEILMLIIFATWTDPGRRMHAQEGYRAEAPKGCFVFGLDVKCNPVCAPLTWLPSRVDRHNGDSAVLVKSLMTS